MFSTIALTLFLQSQPQWLEIGYSQDRCVIEGCIAQVSATKPPLQYIEKTTKEQTSVFYEEDKFYLHYDLRKRIRHFLDEHPTQTKFVVIGWTDGCGDHSYNKELSRKRANEVARYVMSLRKGALVQLEWRGEATGKHTIRARRVDVAVFKKGKQPNTPPKIIYDFYLIDASGSMDGGKFDKWIYAIRYWKPSHAKVYVASTDYIPKWIEIQKVNPSGGTEIWFAYWSILDKMKAGQKLIIISDFDSTIPISTREKQMITNKVRAKGIKVIVIRP
mgnify:FL=1